MRDRKVGDDLRAMVQDVVDIGAQYVHTGREWLDERRDEMTNDSHPSRGPRQNRNRHRQGPGRHGAGQESEGGQGYGGSSGYAGAGADTYLDESVTRHHQRYAAPGDTQPDYYDQSGYDGAGYDDAGYTGSGRRSYSGVGPKNYVRSDSRITEDLCDQLTYDHDVDASDIEVKVADGRATLEGSVAQRWMKHRAEDLADACSGVRHVENRIQVRSVSEGETSQTSTTDSTGTKAGPTRGSTTTGGTTTGL